MTRLLLALVCLCAALGVAQAQQIVINESVYDSPSTDTDTWTELKGPGGMSLDGYRLIGFNGNGGVLYNPIPLDGYTIPADGYFVVAQNGANAWADLVTNLVDFQNGPDSIQLQRNEGGNWVVVDAVGYETHGGSDVFGGEGTPCVGQVPPNSMARCPDGWDTQNNSADFIQDTAPTPGAPNAGSCALPGACCFVDGSCQVLVLAACTQAGGTFQGEGTDCDPNPCEVTQPTDRTLCEIAADDPNTGLPVLMGEWVRVQGIAITDSDTWQTTHLEFNITDGDCCIDVFWSGVTTPLVQTGDRVEVVGTVTHYNGLTELALPDMSVTILSSGNPLPEPALLTTGELAANGENYESCLIKLECVDIVSGTWPAAGQNANLTIDDGTGPVTLRIDKETDIDGSPAPTGPFTLVGVGWQFDSSQPYDSGYQILPRALTDLYLDDCQTFTGACCFIDGSCQVLSPTECAGMGGEYQGDDTVCDPNPCEPQVPTDRTLCEVAEDDPSTGRPVLEGDWVKVRGVALTNSSQWQASSIEFQITDGECCMTIFQSGTTNPFVAIGDEVEVIGTVIIYNGKTEISTPDFSISILSSGNPLPEPALITTGELASNGENYEACLLKIRCASIVSGTWPPAGSDANITIDDGSGPTTLRIDRDTDVDGSPAPTGPFTIIGIGFQFDSSEPYFSGYQIIPRFVDDVLLDDCLPTTGACCFADGSCAVTTIEECNTLGGAYQGDDTLCDPNPCPQPPMACCFADGHCEFVTSEVCLSLGGTPQGYGTVCDPNPCPQPAMACCFDNGDCAFVTAEECTQAGGTPQGYGTDCEPNECPQPPATGACCVDDQGNCEVLTQARCVELGGDYQGDNVPCEPNPCPIVPTQKTTWGQIKHDYR